MYLAGVGVDPRGKRYFDVEKQLSNIYWENIGVVSKENIKFGNILLESEELILRYNKGFSVDI